MAYKVEGLSNIALQFKGQNDDFLQKAFVKSPVFLQIIEIDGRLKIMIDIDEDTTEQQIRDVAPDALRLRDKLIEFQGAWRVGGPNHFFETLCRYHDSGMTYAEIAQMINTKIADHLKDAVTFDDEYRKVFSTLKTHGDYWQWAYGTDGIYKKVNTHGFDHAKDLLEMLHMKDDDITAWLKEGIERIRNNTPPFENNGPVDKNRIINTIRTWRNGKKHKAIKAIEQKEKEEWENKRVVKT